MSLDLPPLRFSETALHGLLYKRSVLADARVQHRTSSTQLASVTRQAELRGGAILLSNPEKLANPPSYGQEVRADSIILLHPGDFWESVTYTSAYRFVVPIGSRTLRIAHNHRLTFDDRDTRDRWHQLILASVYQEHDKLDRYAVVRKLGRGASGSVYLVKDKLANQNSGEKHLYAMKILDKWTTFQTDETLDRVTSERLALERFASSSFVLGLVDAFQTGRHLYLVTELAELGDLERIVRAQPHRRLRAGVVRRIVAEVVLGLEEMHMAGYVYRDLKESNILVRESGHVVLGDLGIVKELGAVVEPDDTSSSSSSDGSTGFVFGAAKTADIWSVASEDGSDDSSTSESSSKGSMWSTRNSTNIGFLSRTRSVSGTRRYMAPEILSHRGNGYDGAVDMWALGVLTYRLLTGRYPFGNDLRGHASSAVHLSYAIENEELTFPADMDDVTVAFIRALLSRDVMRRANVRQIKRHLWFRKLDWDKLRQDAKNDVPVADVLALRQRRTARDEDASLPSSSLARLDRSVRLPSDRDGVRDDMDDHMTELREFLAPVGARKRWRTPNVSKSRGTPRLPELPGFGYIGTAERTHT